jgi:hypothetical protein
MSDKKANPPTGTSKDQLPKVPTLGTVNSNGVIIRDNAATSPIGGGAVKASKLTDKIDAARLKTTGGSSVTQGLQSIMAVIGENYEEQQKPAPAASQASVNEPPKFGGTSLPPGVPKVPDQKPITAAPQDRGNVEATSAISDLLPLLTSDEQNMSHALQYATSSEVQQAQLARSDSTIADLLNQLKSDITTLEKSSLRSRQQLNMPAVIDNASTEVRTLLAELQDDILALRSENNALKTQHNIPVATVGQGSEIKMLLAQLQGDISGLRHENDAMKLKYGISTDGGDAEIAHQLTLLQGDISGLRKESDNYRDYYVGAGRPRSIVIGQTFLMTIGLLALVGGSVIGGMYYVNNLNGQSNENLLSLLGLQQASTQKIEVRKTETVIEKAARAEPKAITPKVVVVAPPPALPKITVKRPKLDSAEVKALMEDAQGLIELGDLVSARQMLEYAMSQNSAEAAYRLGQTFDPLYLATMATVLSVDPDLTRAKVLYYSAARQGHEAASKRLAELRRMPGN